jgi:hypothetical protein
VKTDRYHRIVVAASAVILALAVPLVPIVSSSADATTSTRILTCTQKPTVKPASYTLSCADANAGWIHMTWNSWGATSATGRGFLRQNTCTPNCAAGEFIDYRATVVLSKVVTTHFGALFSRATVRYHEGTKAKVEVFSLID